MGCRVSTDILQWCGAGRGHSAQCMAYSLPEVYRHGAKPCLTGQEILKMAKMWVHFKNRILDGALDKVLLDFYVLTRYNENRSKLKLDILNTHSCHSQVHVSHTLLNISI